ncbi:EVE domain-containing protein [Algiphilus sp.]|uniref:EVE domain-containing protein n=1 Tax=Algiphilus sp. TaxID=1872431 RepID=UPI0025C15FFA|nr:EVE domain-containing protein [Algiphilus sp.]MCK5770595.1 EVE domain-containing protein [Algiphilus sp.]
MAYWLMKSEPDAFSIDDLRDRPQQTEPWDGIRNYQARNFMRDRMQVGDQAFFYHSNCAVPGIVGVMEIASPPYPDPTQFDENSKYFDAKSKPEEPRWQLVDVRYVRHTERNIPLAELREHAEGELAGMQLLMKGNRLSIMPVAEEHWTFILSLE